MTVFQTCGLPIWRGGGRVRIPVQLVDTETGRHLWSDRFEDASSGLFELQDRIASRVAGAINPRIRASEIERARRYTPENLQAYDLVLRALPHFWAHRKEDNEKALVLFDEALARSEEHTSELQSLMRNSYAVFCL